MKNWTVVLTLIIISSLIASGCSGNTNTPVDTTIPLQLTEVDEKGNSESHTSLLGYYEIQVDVENQTMEIVEDRTAAYTINIVPFLNKMVSPASGISFGAINFDASDPTNLKVSVEFGWHHPFPIIEQYKVYDFMGVIISNGDSTLNYHNLRVGNYGTDTYMTNADGYTRWFNPTEFTTEQIFGWAPGGIQNLEGNAKLNPFKAYGMGLSATGSLWDWLEGGSNNDGVFQPGDGRLMKLEFPSPPPGDGLVFGYAAVCCWEEQGMGPYTPYHRAEPIAFRVTVQDNIYYNGTNSGGNLIADIDIWTWGDQPNTVLVESTVLAGIETATPTGGGGANWATYSIDVPSAPINSNDGHEMWVIAECDAYNYINVPGVPAPPGSQPLAAFFRVPLLILTDLCPIIDSGVDGNATPSKDAVEPYEVVAHDPDPGDTLTYTWTVTDNSSGLPAPGYDGVPGDGAGNLDVDWGTLGVSIGDTFDIDCDVDDGQCTVSATTLLITIVNADPICDLVVVTAMPHVGTGRVEFDASGTTDPDVGDVLSFSWDFDGDDVFDDVYESGTDENPVYNYDSDYTGTVSVHVTDGNGGEATCESDPLDVTALREVNPIGTPNIDVIGTKGIPQDIACRPTTGETAISYNLDYNESRYWIWNDDYSSATGPCSPFNGLEMSKFDGNRFGMICGLEYQNTDNNYTAYTRHYWDCSFMGASWFGDPNVPGVLEVANHQVGFHLLGIYDMNTFAFLMRTYSVGSIYFDIKNAPWYNGTGSTGVVMTNIRGMGIAASANGIQYYVYLLEVIPATNTGVVELWNMNPSVPTLMEDFGEDFFYDPLDLTVDSAGNIYILEENADGDPAIWVYDDTGVLIGASDPIDPTYLSGDPLRMDCQLYSNPNEVHVLHSDGLTMFVLE